MITVEDKIRTFSKYVYDKEIKQKEELLRDELAKQEKTRKASEIQMQEENARQEVKQKKKLDLEALRTVASAKSEARNLKHKVKREIQKDLNRSILQAVAEYTASKEYDTWMDSKLAEILDQPEADEIVIWLTKGDQARLEEQLRKDHLNITVDSLDESAAGGILVEFPSKGTRIDFTLKSKLEEMENEIGLQLNEVLDEAVNGND